MSTTILVASATSNTGSKAVALLSQSGKVNVKALVRNPQSEAAQALAAQPHVTVVQGDFKDPASLTAALQGVQRAMLVSSNVFAPGGDDAQTTHEVNFIRAAQEANLELVVRISTFNAYISESSASLYARAHARIESYIREHKCKVVDLQPAFFFSNTIISAQEVKASGTATYPFPPELQHSKFAAIDPRDVAGAAVAILTAPQETVDKLLQAGAVEVHGPELVSFADMFAAISEATGKPIEMKYLEPEAYKERQMAQGVTAEGVDTFLDGFLMMVGGRPCHRPFGTKTSELLLPLFTPKITLKQWATENAAAFSDNSSQWAQENAAASKYTGQ